MGDLERKKVSKKIFGTTKRHRYKLCDKRFVVFPWNDAYKRKTNKVLYMLFSSHIGELVDTGNVDFASQ